DPRAGGLRLRQHPDRPAKLHPRDLRDHRIVHPARADRAPSPTPPPVNGAARAPRAKRPPAPRPPRLESVGPEGRHPPLESGDRGVSMSLTFLETHRKTSAIGTRLLGDTRQLPLGPRGAFGADPPLRGVHGHLRLAPAASATPGPGGRPLR